MLFWSTNVSICLFLSLLLSLPLSISIGGGRKDKMTHIAMTHCHDANGIPTLLKYTQMVSMYITPHRSDVVFSLARLHMQTLLCALKHTLQDKLYIITNIPLKVKDNNKPVLSKLILSSILIILPLIHKLKGNHYLPTARTLAYLQSSHNVNMG